MNPKSRLIVTSMLGLAALSAVAISAHDRYTLKLPAASRSPTSRATGTGS